MDTSYLKSGQAWVLVGSGLSAALGYPSWQDIALRVKDVVHVEASSKDLKSLDKAYTVKDFPLVFEYATRLIGSARIRQCLEDIMKPSEDSEVYNLIASWPVPVYLTTNYDDEISKRLALLKEAYTTYSNSEDHLSHLVPDVSGIIVKLHGDLRSDKGLILTRSQYKAIADSKEWLYWRTKMTSIFQMTPVVVIGHSLTDPHIRHVLSAAKNGSGVLRPVCWVAPNVRQDEAKTLLEMYRIRVIPYYDGDGSHQNLVRLIQTISNFLPPRTAVRIRKEIDEVSKSPLGKNAAAPGFYVFNTLVRRADFDEKRVDIVAAAVKAVLPQLATLRDFEFEQALAMAGWPKEVPMQAQLRDAVISNLVKGNLLERKGDSFRVTANAEGQSKTDQKVFERMRDRFRESVKLKVQRKYGMLSEADAVEVADDIESALTGFFREGGLTLASALFATQKGASRQTIPSSMLKFISEASAKYDDLLRRQAFVTAPVDAFVEAEAAEREYLGRVAQGFFSFHALGVFGDAALERLKHAKETLWLVDSDVQIPTLALGAPTNFVFRNCFQRLKAAGIRLFATEKLFWETHGHIRFANNVIEMHGKNSPMIIAAAIGQAPYTKSNQFLEGFVKWQEAGNPSNWESYMYNAFGCATCGREDVKRALEKVGIEVVNFDNWPGFEKSDQSHVDSYKEQIISVRAKRVSAGDVDLEEIRKKAEPEAEAFVVVKNERSGKYYMLSKDNSSAWFVSHTAILNALEPNLKVTWLPEAFLSFASTVGNASSKTIADEAFQTLLWGLAQSGINLLDEKTITAAFGGIIDQATVDIAEQRERYRNTIEEKYAEPLDSVMAKISGAYRPLAVVQIATEIAKVEENRRILAENKAQEADRQVKTLEKKLEAVDRFRRKMEERQGRKVKRRKKKKPGKKR